MGLTGLIFPGGLRRFAGRNQHLTWWQSAADLPHPDNGPSSWDGTEPTESRRLATLWLWLQSTRLALIQTPDFCIWNSGSYSRDTASLWLRNTGHISGFPWSQERGLHGSSLHMAYQGISQALQHHKPSPLINPLPHISAGSRDKNTLTQRSGINIQLKTAAEPLYLGENMLGPFIKRKIP